MTSSFGHWKTPEFSHLIEHGLAADRWKTPRERREQAAIKYSR